MPLSRDLVLARVNVQHDAVAVERRPDGAVLLDEIYILADDLRVEVWSFETERGDCECCRSAFVWNIQAKAARTDDESYGKPIIIAHL